MRSFYKWMDQLLFTKKISKYLQRKRTKSKMIHSIIFPVTYIILLGYLPGINEESNPLNSLYQVIQKMVPQPCLSRAIYLVLLLLTTSYNKCFIAIYFNSLLCTPIFPQMLEVRSLGGLLDGFFWYMLGRLVHFPLHVN